MSDALTDLMLDLAEKCEQAYFGQASLEFPDIKEVQSPKRAFILGWKKAFENLNIQNPMELHKNYQSQIEGLEKVLAYKEDEVAMYREQANELSETIGSILSKREYE